MGGAAPPHPVQREPRGAAAPARWVLLLLPAAALGQRTADDGLAQAYTVLGCTGDPTWCGTYLRKSINDHPYDCNGARSFQMPQAGDTGPMLWRYGELEAQWYIGPVEHRCQQTDNRNGLYAYSSWNAAGRHIANGVVVAGYGSPTPDGSVVRTPQGHSVWQPAQAGSQTGAQDQGSSRAPPPPQANLHRGPDGEEFQPWMIVADRGSEICTLPPCPTADITVIAARGTDVDLCGGVDCSGGSLASEAGRKHGDCDGGTGLCICADGFFGHRCRWACDGDRQLEVAGLDPDRHEYQIWAVGQQREHACNPRAPPPPPPPSRAGRRGSASYSKDAGPIFVALLVGAFALLVADRAV